MKIIRSVYTACVQWKRTAALLMVLLPTLGQGQQTAFTYQGELRVSGQPANGAYDLQFFLFDSDDFATGNMTAGPVNIEDFAVADGSLNVLIDFGGEVFGVTEPWLEIRVRDGGSSGPFTTLAPRQLVTPSPLSIHAQRVAAGAIDTEALAAGAVGSGQIADGSIEAPDVDATQIQLRVGDSCPEEFAIRSIAADGSVVCEAATGTEYAAGSGLILTDQEFSVDPTQVQTRVVGTCQEGHLVTGINEDGSLICAATPVTCSIELACPPPDAGKSCVAGRLLAAHNGAQQLSEVGLPGTLCGGGASGGVCDLNLEPHDLLAFAGDPGTSPPLTYGSLILDSCGRFVFENLTPPATGVAVIVVDDGGVEVAPTGHILPVVENEVVEEVRSQVVTTAINETWTDTAGNPFGAATFAEVGAILALFSIDDVPTPSVTITRSGSPVAAHDFYFSDPNEISRFTISNASSAGANGAGLMVNSGLENHSGQGGEFGSCAWPDRLADAIPGYITVVEFRVGDC